MIEASSRFVLSEAQALTSWFRVHRRELPWRKDLLSDTDSHSVAEPSSVLPPALRRDPYATWISEIMLQQTQVSTVVEYFSRWMIRFPDVFALASAREAEVMEAWAGLGYYSRARNLLATARIVVDEFAGRFPWQRNDLLGLKGIGEYTAGAIASLAFNLPEPILDGNLVRVFSRRYGMEFLPETREGKAKYWDWARAWVESHDPALVNEGLMELGATICTPKQPACGRCPLAASCHARAAGSQDRFPPAKARKAVQHISGFAVVAIRGGKDPGSKLFQGEALIYRARAPELLKGLWSFPIFTVPDLTSLTVAWQEFLPKVNVFNFVLHPHAVVHSITHHRIQLKVVMVDVGVLAKGKREACLPEGFQWVPVTELERLWVSSLPRKIWKTVRQS